MRVLFATSEVYPLIKTGGLADVCGALPIALHQAEVDVRIIMPAYSSILERNTNIKKIANFKLGHPAANIEIYESILNENGLVVYFVRIDELFDRGEFPYVDESGLPWSDNSYRFVQFSRIVAKIALDQGILNWQVNVIHAHDWQTGMVAALLSNEPQKPKTVFTIHNLAYQGITPKSEFDYFALDKSLWSMHGLEFYGNWSLLKGGIVYSDWVTTVSPNYAKEICHSEQGYGLDQVLLSRQEKLRGILNGADYDVWNPEIDTHIYRRYSEKTLSDKLENKQALQNELGLELAPKKFLIGIVSRLAKQKGVDVFFESIQSFLEQDLCQLALVGTGDKDLEDMANQLSERYPNAVATRITYSEVLSHKVIAAVDAFAIPSRYEPCGLTQMYAMRYGTIPIVRDTGGLADTVHDAHETQHFAWTGFKFGPMDSEHLSDAIKRAIDCYRNDVQWKELQLNCMHQQYDWQHSAKEYIELYKEQSEEKLI